jgi:hypothetical protein
MATLDSLKQKLRCAAAEIESSQPAQMSPLSDAQYSAGFDTFEGQTAYRDFITPPLSLLLESLLETRSSVSILEVGPGPKSVLARLPGYLRRRISKYTAFEPNRLFVSRLEKSLRSESGGGGPLHCLETLPDIKAVPFPPKEMTSSGSQKEFDMILFCHSMYGMQDKHQVIKHALDLLREQSGEEMVVVFHRDGSLKLNSLACRQMAVFPTGVAHVRDNDEALVGFADFVAGSAAGDTVAAKSVHEAYRKVCRALGGKGKPGHLLFSSPEIMVTFEKHAAKLSALTEQIPLVNGETRIKNREARIRHPAAVVRPETIQHVQQ